jgi:hypothetical protein
MKNVLPRIDRPFKKTIGKYERRKYEQGFRPSKKFQKNKKERKERKKRINPSDS